MSELAKSARAVKMVLDKKGIALMEVIIALGVIITGVIGGVYLTSYNLGLALNGEHRLIAANLAREAIEVIRQKRDTNWLNANPWDQGIFTTEKYRYLVDFNPETLDWQLAFKDVDLADCGEDCRLYLDNETSAYSHSQTADYQTTAYKRLLTMREICWMVATSQELVLPDGQACATGGYGELIGWQLASTVSWQQPGANGDLTIIDELYDWK